MGNIIEINNLGKKYRIMHGGTSYVALRDILTNVIRHPFGFLKRKVKKIVQHNVSEDFWALKNINLKIKKGEIVGIIGRNGAGKSTLLKILSQITPPSEGEIVLRGKVGSLLEVGSGFHPELSGRENILLNGAILGMTKKEILSKFSEIVAFAGVEKFLDTPVKYYSSGMYVRLAFSVAAHMDPDILIIDEVLAVGDIEFQKKCLGKMDDVSKKQGRTILFVSHNMNAVEQLCDRVILLDKGIVVGDSSDVRSVIKQYVFGQSKEDARVVWNNSGKEYQNEFFVPSKIALTNEKGEQLLMPVRNDAEIWVQVEGEILDPNSHLNMGYAVFNEEGSMLYWSLTTDAEEKDWPTLKKGIFKIKSKIPTHLLNEGVYRIELISSLHYIQWLTEPGVRAPAVYLAIQGGLSDSPYWMMKRPGVLALVNKWEKLT
jgi:lipopolysaccharide transport system ATP-binding protein